LLNPRSSGHTRSGADLAVTSLPLRGRASPAPGGSTSWGRQAWRSPPEPWISGTG